MNFLSNCFKALLGLALALVAASSRAEISLLDDLGNRVILAQPAKRIVALAPHLVELVYAVGAGNNLVGAVSYSDYPEAAKQLPRVGTSQAFSVEAILRLKPDLILAWHSGNGTRRVEPIRALGIPIFYTEPRELEDIGRVMANIGALTASPEAQTARQNYDLELERLQRQYSSAEPVTVFYQVWNQPLRTLNGEHLISDVIRLCGGRNIFADATAFAPQVSIESVLRLNPQVIIASGMDQERPEWLQEWRAWPSLRAVQNGQLKFIPPDIIQRQTPRILLGAVMMCEHLQNARQHYSTKSI